MATDNYHLLIVFLQLVVALSGWAVAFWLYWHLAKAHAHIKNYMRSSLPEVSRASHYS